jgi:hypothetical protein
MSPQLESLEGKTLLSAGSAMQHVAPRLATAPIVGQTASFRGTLVGSDTPNVSGISIVSFNTTGNLIGPGVTHLFGTLYALGKPQPGQLLGQLLLRNRGGSMKLNVYRSGTTGTFTDTVVSARGADTIYRGATGNLQIAMALNESLPYYTYQQAWMKFIPG